MILVIFSFSFILSRVLNAAFFEDLYVFEFTLFLHKICFSVYGLEPSKNLSLQQARLAQSDKRYASQSLHDCDTAHIHARVDLPSKNHGSVI